MILIGFILIALGIFVFAIMEEPEGILFGVAGAFILLMGMADDGEEVEEDPAPAVEVVEENVEVKEAIEGYCTSENVELLIKDLFIVISDIDDDIKYEYVSDKDMLLEMELGIDNVYEYDDSYTIKEVYEMYCN